MQPRLKWQEGDKGRSLFQRWSHPAAPPAPGWPPMRAQHGYCQLAAMAEECRWSHRGDAGGLTPTGLWRHHRRAHTTGTGLEHPANLAEKEKPLSLPTARQRPTPLARGARQDSELETPARARACSAPSSTPAAPSTGDRAASTRRAWGNPLRLVHRLGSNKDKCYQQNSKCFFNQRKRCFPPDPAEKLLAGHETR